MYPLTGDEKYGCVAHSMTIAALTSDGHDGKQEHAKGLINHIWLNNCQVLPFLKYWMKIDPYIFETLQKLTNFEIYYKK